MHTQTMNKKGHNEQIQRIIFGQFLTYEEETLCKHKSCTFKEEKSTRSNRMNFVGERISLNKHTTQLLVIKIYLLHHVSFVMVCSQNFEKMNELFVNRLMRRRVKILFKNKMSPTIDLQLNTQMRKRRNTARLMSMHFHIFYLLIFF